MAVHFTRKQFKIESKKTQPFQGKSHGENTCRQKLGGKTPFDCIFYLEFHIYAEIYDWVNYQFYLLCDTYKVLMLHNYQLLRTHPHTELFTDHMKIKYQYNNFFLQSRNYIPLISPARFHMPPVAFPVSICNIQ